MKNFIQNQGIKRINIKEAVLVSRFYTGRLKREEF